MPRSASRARWLLVAELTAQGVAVTGLADAALILSELVGNAIRHARPPADGLLTVTWWVEASQLRLEVTDGGSASTPHIDRPRDDATGGRGLLMVDKLSDAWGVRHNGAGSTVWTLVPLRVLTGGSR